MFLIQQLLEHLGGREEREEGREEEREEVREKWREEREGEKEGEWKEEKVSLSNNVVFFLLHEALSPSSPPSAETQTVLC